jgi:O-antigen/teichoic acid export membrane protein
MTIGRVAEKGLTFLATLVLVRLLTKEEYGSYLQIALVSQLAVSVFLFGLPLALPYFVPRALTHERRHVVTVIGSVIAATAFVGAIGIALGGGLLSRGFTNPIFVQLSFLVAIFTFFYCLDRTIETIFIVIGEAHRSAVLTSVSAALLLATSLTAAMKGFGVEGIYVGWLLVILIRLGYAGLVVGRLPSRTGSEPVEGFSVPALVRFAVPMGFSAIVTQYNRMLDGLVVSLLFTPPEYAVYARGAFELPVVDLVPFTLANVIAPALARLWKEGDRVTFLALWNRSLRTSAMLIFPAFGYAALFAHDLVVTLFTQAYEGAVPVFFVYLLALPLRLTHYPTLLIAVGETASILVPTLVGLAFNVALSLTLCRWLGPVGAAIGFLVSQFAVAGGLLHRTRKATGFGLRELLPWRALARTGSVVLLSALSARALGMLLPDVRIRLVVAALVFGALCLAGYVWLGIVGRDERDYLRRWMERAGLRPA